MQGNRSLFPGLLPVAGVALLLYRRPQRPEVFRRPSLLLLHLANVAACCTRRSKLTGAMRIANVKSQQGGTYLLEGPARFPRLPLPLLWGPLPRVALHQLRQKGLASQQQPRRPGLGCRLSLPLRWQQRLDLGLAARHGRQPRKLT